LDVIFNGLFVRRARPTASAEWNPAVLIPARNEAENLARLVPVLVAQGVKVYVYDDESTDGTAEAAAKAGALVVRASGPLPEGWTGKSRACHELSKIVAEDHEGGHLVFIDADTYPEPTFIASLGALVTTSRAPVLTGFPRIIPGEGLEPLYLGWVTWAIGAQISFGLMTATGMGHPRFLNGQIHVWQKSVYYDLMPHEMVKAEVLEDVQMGRELARRGIRIEAVDLVDVFAVNMYRTLREAIDGMSKNTVFVSGGSGAGAFALGLYFLVVAWAWVLAGTWAWAPLGMLILSKLLLDLRTKLPLWTAFFMPITLTMAAYTVARSWWWKRTGRIVWKGRTYG